MIGTPPTETNTRAYNGNSVASVYISSGYGDLVAKTDGLPGQNVQFDDPSLSLQNGIYGMSDPANLQGLVERFEVELEQGGTSKGTYRLRLINPTDELELFLFGIYNAVFPSTKTSFDIYAEAALEQQAKTTVNAVDQDNPLKDLLSRGMQLPFLYLRWGYGTKLEEGLSRIHKCVLFSCDYSINANKDKVIELHLIDWFSSLAENQTFNVAPHLTEVSCLDENKQLKNFNVVVEELITKYSGVFPGIIPLYDSDSSNMEQLRVIANNMAVLRWDEYLEYEKTDSVGQPLNFANFVASSTAETAADTLGSADVLTISDDLTLGKDFSDSENELSAAHKIWLGAYSEIFKFLGIKQSHSSDQGDIQPVSLSNSGFNAPDSRSALGKAFNEYKENVSIKTTEIGVLDFMVPVWEAPEFKPTWLTVDPLIGALPSPLTQPFLTPRTINLNPNPVMQAEMASNLSPTVQGPFVKGYLSATQNANRFDAVGTDREVAQIGAYEISFADFENIMGGIRELSSDLLSFKPIEMLGPKSPYLPNAVITFPTLLASQPNYTDITFQEADFLLYSPLAAETSVESLFVGFLPPHELRSFGTFQTKGAIAANPFVPVSPNETTAGNNSSIKKAYPITNFTFKHSISSQYTPIISLVPSPQAIVTLEAKFLELQIEVLAGAQAAVSKQSFLDKAKHLIFAGELSEDGNPFLDTTDIRDLEAPYSHSVTAFLGTGNSTTPHITGVMIALVTGLNKLVVGEADAFVVQQVDLTQLTPEELTDMFKPTGLLYSLNLFAEEEAQIYFDRPTLLLVGRSRWLVNAFSNRLLSKINSFPEITRVEEEYQDYIFLSYGQKDSIVTDLNFTGDIRTLYNIPRAFYSTKQFNSLQGFFKTTSDSETNQMLKDMILFVHDTQNEKTLSNLKYALTQVSDDELTKELLKERDAIETERADIQNLNAIDYLTHKEYLEMFPALITEFTDEQLESAGFKDPLAARKITSILGSKEFTEILFPVKDYSDQSSKHGYANSQGSKIISRQLDVAYFNQKLSQLERASMDAKMNYVENTQDEAWQVQIATLGIPEIDVMGAEFFARRVYLTVNTPRGGKTKEGTEGLHWLSGIYSIVGIRHELEPSSGFITNLSLVKVPAAAMTTYA